MSITSWIDGRIKVAVDQLVIDIKAMLADQTSELISTTEKQTELLIDHTGEQVQLVADKIENISDSLFQNLTSFIKGLFPHIPGL